MTSQIKITQLSDIGNNIANTTLVPVVNMTGVSTTQKATMGNIANSILAGAGTAYQNANIANIALSVANAAQPNITSVGNLTSLTVNGNAYLGNISSTGDTNVTALYVGAIADLGDVANVTIGGGTDGYVLQTDGAGNLSWTAQTGGGGGGSPGGANTQVQFNNAGSFGAESDFTYDFANNILNVIRANVSYLTAYTSITGGNSVTANYFIGSGANLTNIAGANVSGFVANANVANTAFAIAAANVSGLGNIATINLTGSNSNVLYGNGVFAPASGGGNSNQISNGNSNVSVPTSNDNVYITTNDGNSKQWIFNKDGTLRTPGNVDIVGAINFPQQVSNINWSTYNIELSQYGRITTNVDFFANANTIGAQYLKGDGSNISNINAANISNAYGDSNVANYLPTFTGNLNGNSLTVQQDVSGNGALRLQGIANGNSTINIGGEADIDIVANVGNINLYTANNQPWIFDQDGNLTLPGNTFAVNYANGTQVNIGGGGGNTGNVTFDNINVIGTGNLNLQPDPANSGSYLDIFLSSGPDIHIVASAGANLILGKDNQSNVMTSWDGNVYVQSWDNNTNTQGGVWTFDGTGNLGLPSGGSIYSQSSTPSGAPGNTITLQPAGSGITTNQKLLVYPTAADGDHIHMTSGNLYETELFLGSDNLYVKLANTGNVVINSNDGNSSNAMWTFGTNGNLTLPGNLVINGLTNVFGSNVALLESNPDLPLLSISSGSNGGVSSFWAEDIGNIGASNIAAVYTNPTPGSKIVRIAVGQNGNSPYLWDFNANGTLTIPSGLIGSGASPAPYISGFDSISSISVSASGNISANNFTGNGGSLSNVATKTTGSWTLASGNNTVSISVPLSGTYSIWVNGNIPNGIVTYIATAVVTNTNVPVLGEQYGWYYEAGNALVLTSIPNQFVGTQGAISNAAPYSGNTANVFTFGITNNSGANAVVNWGYTKL